MNSFPRFPGTPWTAKLFHDAEASSHASVIWYASSVCPLFLIVMPRLAFTIREPAGICPGFGPTIDGNLISVLHTVPAAMQSSPSTSSFNAVP